VIANTLEVGEAFSLPFHPTVAAVLFGDKEERCGWVRERSISLAVMALMLLLLVALVLVVGGWLVERAD